MAKLKITENQARGKAERLAEVTAAIRKNEAEMNEKLNNLHQEYATKSAAWIEEEKKLKKELLEYVKANRSLFPTNKRSFNWGSVRFSYRLTPPKVGIVSGMTWDMAVDRLKEAGLVEYVRTIEEVSKEAIQIAVDSPEGGNELRAELSKMGITITQSEKWDAEVAEVELV